LLVLQHERTALFLAAREGHANIVEYLITEHKVDVNAWAQVCNLNNYLLSLWFSLTELLLQNVASCLLIAAVEDKEDMVKLLLKLGANVNSTNNVMLPVQCSDIDLWK